jgi:hypothetical protein
MNHLDRYRRAITPRARSSRPQLASHLVGSVAILALVAIAACSDSDSGNNGGAAGSNDGGAAGSADALTGEQLFNRPLPGTNGRACASCHVPEDNFTLTPDHVARVFAANSNDPLFAAIDADDPTPIR